MKEILHKDFSNLDLIKEQLSSYDACFFCMGVSSFRMSEEQYSKITFDTVKAFADTLYKKNPDMLFNYVSGMGTDSSEMGKTMWQE